MEFRNVWASVLIAVLMPVILLGQEAETEVRGIVVDEDQPEIPLVGVNLLWLGTQIGTSTDEEGKFTIETNSSSNQLVISYIGYNTDTVEVLRREPLTIRLHRGSTLQGVEVVHRKKATEFSLLNTAKVEKINEKELLKAACCNLSESFETNPSVDVAFTDAVTGTRQIQMLGLAGPYTQITRENMPYIRGLASAYGLTFVPGTWVEGMQLTKGAGSVVNGFESIAGQINIELRKPEASDRMYLNLYSNTGARFEANAHFSTKVNDQWSTGLLLHGKSSTRKMDRNGDHFLDDPLGQQFFAINRWKYQDENGLRFQFGINGTHINNTGGETGFDRKKHALGNQNWGFHLLTNRLEGWVKMGKVYETLPWRSWAIQIHAADHQQDSYFGQRTYSTSQRSLYSNFLYQSILGNTNHQILMGVSLQYDDNREDFENMLYDRREMVPGGFFEYTYGGHDKISLVAGLRADHHNLFGFFVTPRLHLRYGISDQLVWRFSAGRGQRTANILSENTGLMASSRQFRILNNDSQTPYGLDAEVAWNAGTNGIYSFYFKQHPGTVTFDFYHTFFLNQIVIDLDRSASEVFFYNLEGRSYATSAQFQLDYELARSLDIRMAYRFYDVKTTLHQELLEKPLVAKHRFFVNLAYSTANHWGFDYTFNWQGSKRIPNTRSNPPPYQLANRSPSFFVMNTQISKEWSGKFSVYLGAENLLNFRQERPILSSENPFGPYFDSSLVWGPVFGRNIYLGLRYRV